MNRIALLLVAQFFIISAFSQSQKRVLPPNVNQPSVNLYAPVISGDGEVMVYLSDYTDDGHHSMYFATKSGVSSWNDPVEVTKLVNRPTLNYRGGYCLSFDGDMLVFTSRKSGLGGFELWYTTRDGANWRTPSNFGMPINSASNEGTPSLSSDGEYMYFMRCDQMAEYKGASGCTLYVARKRFNKWEDPVPLPGNINTGNSQNPKILADGETLIFSSDRFGGKGGMDLFMTKKTGDSWSDPTPLDFMNTDKDDQFISIPAKGRYLYTSQHNGRNFELVQLLIPDEFQPKKVMRINGSVVDKGTGDPVNARMTVFNVDLRDRIINEQLGAPGEFALVLNEGSTYDLAFTHPDPSYIYYSKIYALETIGRRDKQNLKVELSPLTIGSEFTSDILFEENSSTIDDRSIYELRRLADMVRRNPAMTLELMVSQNNYLEDSIQSSPDLTEVLIDSIIVKKKVPITMDSIGLVTTDSLSGNELSPGDSLAMTSGADRDSVAVQFKEIEELKINYTYHNDRTDAQGEAIKTYLVDHGGKADNIMIKTSRQPAAAELDEDEVEVSVTIRIKGI